MVRGHHNKGTILKGHSIRKVKNQCPRRMDKMEHASIIALRKWRILGKEETNNIRLEWFVGFVKEDTLIPQESVTANSAQSLDTYI